MHTDVQGIRIAAFALICVKQGSLSLRFFSSQERKIHDLVGEDSMSDIDACSGGDRLRP